MGQQARMHRFEEMGIWVCCNQYAEDDHSLLYQIYFCEKIPPLIKQGHKKNEDLCFIFHILSLLLVHIWDAKPDLLWPNKFVDKHLSASDWFGTRHQCACLLSQWVHEEKLIQILTDGIDLQDTIWLNPGYLNLYGLRFDYRNRINLHLFKV